MGAEREILVPEHTTWREEDGVIYFSVTSDGTTGLQWIKRLRKKLFHISGLAESVLCSSDFKPTKGVTTEIAILKNMLFEDHKLITTKNIIDLATDRKLTTPNAEVACLIRENFSDEDIKAMGLIGIVTMHEPIKDYYNDPSLLRAHQRGIGRWLGTCFGGPLGGGFRDDGFALLVSTILPLRLKSL